MKAFAADAIGATAIEYTLIAAIISIVIVTGMTLMGQAVRGFFNAVLAGFF